MKFMNCTSCQRVVQVNNTGICLGCQRGFMREPQEDSWKPPTPVYNGVDFKEKRPDAIQKPSPKEVLLQKTSSPSKKVGSSHPKRKKAPQKSKKEK